MGKNYLFVGKGKSLVVTESLPDGAKTIDDKDAGDIDRLARQRQEIGKQITDKLKENGYVTASDEETEVVE